MHIRKYTFYRARNIHSTSYVDDDCQMRSHTGVCEIKTHLGRACIFNVSITCIYSGYLRVHWTIEGTSRNLSRETGVGSARSSA